MNRRTVAFPVLLMIGAFAALAWAQEGWKTPPVMTHEAEGRADCLMCHKAGGMKPVPEGHAGLKNDQCLMCHAKDAAVQTTAPPAIPHELEGRDNCLMCHQAGGMKPVPADHEGRTNEECQLCHKPAA